MKINYPLLVKAGYGFLFLLWVGLGCEDVVDVEVSSEPPRLIIDALIRVDTTLAIIPVRVKVRKTAGFFDQIPVTGLKQITISNETGAYGVLLENDEGSGVYETAVSLPFLRDGGEVIMQIEHEDQRYFARTRYVPSVPIDSLRQGENSLSGEDKTELIVSFTDYPDRDDLYLFDFDLNEYLVTKDEFYQGQPYSFSYFYDKKPEPGQQLEISILGVDRTFYNYMAQLIEQSSDPLGPFQTPVATVRGNIFNVTEIDNIDYYDNVYQPNNFPLGYFAICQEYKKTIVLEP